ncbi:MAG: kinase [Candidatus Omnitrophica bacterium]|nr:kinase [Candidatus Omnitrophota bacterium]
MIISRTPFRVSFFGGGTDYPAWFREHGGSTLATAIQHFCYITCRWLPPFFKHTHRIVWSQIELVQTLDEIQHPAVREALRFLRIPLGVELHHDGDLPARSGLGSSSSFTVGLLNALYALRGERPGPMRLAEDAIRVEQDWVRENVGSQDQVTAAFGGFNRIDFHPDGSLQVHPIHLSPERRLELEAHLMLVYTGLSRTASEIAADQIRAVREKRPLFAELQQMVTEAQRLLTGEDSLDDFGQLLHEGWKLKKGISERISTSQVDQAYEAARRSGALGGKLLGAGGGGFLLLMVRPEDRPNVREALGELLEVPLRFEPSGSQIIFRGSDAALPAPLPAKVTLEAS